jgi:hypothetical protein
VPTQPSASRAGRAGRAGSRAKATLNDIPNLQRSNRSGFLLEMTETHIRTCCCGTIHVVAAAVEPRHLAVRISQGGSELISNSASHSYHHVSALAVPSQCFCTSGMAATNFFTCWRNARLRGTSGRLVVAMCRTTDRPRESNDGASEKDSGGIEEREEGKETEQEQERQLNTPPDRCQRRCEALRRSFPTARAIRA